MQSRAAAETVGGTRHRLDAQPAAPLAGWLGIPGVDLNERALVVERHTPTLRPSGARSQAQANPSPVRLRSVKV